MCSKTKQLKILLEKLPKDKMFRKRSGLGFSYEISNLYISFLFSFHISGETIDESSSLDKTASSNPEIMTDNVSW